MNLNIKACLFCTCLFLFSFSALSKIIRDDHYTIDFKVYSFQAVCKKLTQRESPLIEVVGISQLDCMGKKVFISKFCEVVEASNPYYTRGKIDKLSKAVHCLSAKRVILKWECEGESDQYCKDKEVGCFLFKEKLAYRLKLVHASLTEKKFLNCYFDTNENELNLNL